MLIALVPVVGGVVSFFALRGGDDAQPTRTVSASHTVATESDTAGMPDVVGARYPDAVEELLAAGLFPDSFPVGSTEKRGIVVGERPAAGKQVVLGSGVRIDVSLGSGKRGERQVPDLTGLVLGDALRVCAESGFTCRAVPSGGAGREVAGERPVEVPAELSQIELSTG